MVLCCIPTNIDRAGPCPNAIFLGDADENRIVPVLGQINGALKTDMAMCVNVGHPEDFDEARQHT